MKSCTLFLLLALISCGKNVTKTKFIENKFNDSNIQNQLIAHEARIIALEDAQQGFLTSEQIDEKLKIIDTLATKSELMEIKSICDSREQLLKSGNKLFAVISTITKVGQGTNQHDNVSNVHLGEVIDGSYMLTDGSNVTFKVVDGEVTNCKLL